MTDSTQLTTRSSPSEIVERGRRVLALEAKALVEMAQSLNDDFARAINLLASCGGRVIIAGVGKSGLIGRKIAATLTSTGTPAMFLHPVEGLHGDLGIVGSGDVAMLISKSGESDELMGLIDALSRLGVHIIAITSGVNSRLAKSAEVVLDLGVREEACPHDLAPTTSTTATLAMGDAIAVALLQEKGFRAEDFARLHPGGALGRRLLTRVRDVMESERLPIVTRDATMIDAVVPLASRRGIAIIMDHQRVVGVVTAGDLARLIQKSTDLLVMPVSSVMTASPKLAYDDELGSAVVHRMETHGIIAMPVLDADHALVGVIHLHDLMRAGVS